MYKIYLSFLVVFFVSKNYAQEVIASYEDFQTAFNDLSGYYRVVIIADPSCSVCHGHNVEAYPLFTDSCGVSSELRIMYLWTKVLGGTTQNSVIPRMGTFDDSRAIHYWDQNNVAADLFLTTLGMNTSYYTAWKTYSIYDKGTTWDGAYPPTPVFWSHWLTTSSGAGADQNYYWNYNVFSDSLSQTAKCGVYSGINDMLPQSVNWVVNNNQLHIDNIFSEEEILLSVYDISGKKIIDTKLGANFTFDFANHSKNLYIMNLRIANKNYPVKFLNY